MNRHFKIIMIAMGIMLVSLNAASAQDQLNFNHNVTVRVDGRQYEMTLYSNSAADDFYEKLPITSAANDYAGQEKTCKLDESLDMSDTPESYEPQSPQVCYYRPTNMITLCYGDIGDFPGIVPIGQINATADELENIPENSEVTFEVKN